MTMRYQISLLFIVVLFLSVGIISGCSKSQSDNVRYQADWRSLKNHYHPQWLLDAKFGIYTHWLPSKFGPLSEFKAEKFDPDEWAELFKKAGAKFAGPVAEHGGAIAMWDSKLTDRDVMDQGPHRDVVGELKETITQRGMKYMVSFHKHADGARFRGKFKEVVDKYQPDLIWFDNKLGGTLDAENWGRYIDGKLLYDKDNFLGGTPEIQPFPGGTREYLRKEFIAYYYNQARKWGKEVEVVYKKHDFPPGVGMRDIEDGRLGMLTWDVWMSDVDIGDPTSWAYREGMNFKSSKTLIHELVDLVSKNGILLLNIGPKPDGTIPQQAIERLSDMGEWLKVNGEAIYGTTAWIMYGEGPTELKSLDLSQYAKNHTMSFKHIIELISAGEIQCGHYTQKYKVNYQPQDVRFTCKGDTLYAICLGWPGEALTIRSLGTDGAFYPDEIESIQMLGIEEPLQWDLKADGLTITTPKQKPCEHAFSFKIIRKIF